ncbi:MAG: hypothetical protein V8Q36_10825 [Anaerotignum sp.]
MEIMRISPPQMQEKLKEAMGDDLAYVGFNQSLRKDMTVGRRTKTLYVTGLAENQHSHEKSEDHLWQKCSVIKIFRKNAITLFCRKKQQKVKGRCQCRWENSQKLKLNET